MAQLESASIHGRFQPFHNGHLHYALQAFNVSEFVYVGLTQLFPSGKTARHRDQANANPLGYFERMGLVEIALVGAGISTQRFKVVPFPIEEPEHLSRFLPISIPCLTTVVDKWNEEKIDLLRSKGYRVEVLTTAPHDSLSITSGSRIRELIRAGDASWRRFVPPEVATKIADLQASRF